MVKFLTVATVIICVFLAVYGEYKIIILIVLVYGGLFLLMEWAVNKDIKTGNTPFSREQAIKRILYILFILSIIARVWYKH